jgi:phosphoribosylglycinamide formyltransferase 1
MTIGIVVLASGRGSDFQSLIDAKKAGALDANILVLITDNPQAGAIARANEAGIPAIVINGKQFEKDEFDEILMRRLEMFNPDLIVLAGYMRILRSKALLEKYAGKIINIHPSLLPKYPGAHAQKDAFDAGEKMSGLTIHFVDESLDGGPVIYQEPIDISGCKSADEASAKILEREHVALPMIVDSFAKGHYSVDGKKTKYARGK